MLDFAPVKIQKQSPVTSLSENFYAQWRPQSAAANFLRDEQFPTERLLQRIWQHQRLKRDALKTTDGEIVRVFHPGFASVEGGPDFCNAVLQIGGDAPRSGDVEIDLRSAGWHVHGHDRNKNFQNVLLHAVWDETKSASNGNVPAILILKNALDAPLAELSLSLENESLRSLPENLRGKCCAPLRELDETKLAELLRQAARVRFENKAAQFRARAKNVGWEQTLWENLFRALGYKHNVWPMQNLAETIVAHASRLCDENLKRTGGMPVPLLALQARLLGVSGLLPDELTRAQKSSDTYLRRVWDFWWKFHGLRPANHPQRRLALASHWLADGNFISKIEGWAIGVEQASRLSSVSQKNETGATPVLQTENCAALLKILQPPMDEFWSWHWTFKSARMKKPQPLLGGARVTDLAVNVILPWLWIRAKEGGNQKIRREVEQRFFAWPAAEDNSILKLARQRLLGTSNARVLKTAAAQQGLMQIVRDFCGHSNAVCDDCRFPELVRAAKSTL